MLRLFNTLGKRMQTFYPVNKKVVHIFTCGPSVYQRTHIGNFRTFLFEDVLVRYLEYLGYTVLRGMNLTDIEDKALKEAEKQRKTVQYLTGENIKTFVREMKLLRMKIPDYLPRASESVKEAAEVIMRLLEHRRAYWYKGNIYFDPLQFPGFGKLYGLDMSRWPRKRRRFHKDTYPGMQWNLGDFIIWHGYKRDDKYFWETELGKGRPSWNVQDPSMIVKHFQETLSIYCGGVDNLFRHHDYTRAILESIRPYPMARFWLHCNHLYVRGQKMSKSKGNIVYTDDLRKQGYTAQEIRFFLIYARYRERINYSPELMGTAVDKLRLFKRLARKIEKKTGKKKTSKGRMPSTLKMIFVEHMNNNLDIKNAFDELLKIIKDIDVEKLTPFKASGIMCTLREIDEVLNLVF
jgi:cysteinyl-tRNA synthetase